jgi:sigma-B regulation protein RsbU (phosphoserine phosphatase)
MPFHRPPAAGLLGPLGYCWRLHPAHGEVLSGDALFMETGRKDRRTLFLFLDVAGHGAPAAQVVRYLDGGVLRDPECANHPPAELLRVLHGMLEPVWLDTCRFVAALGLLVDGSQVEAAAAGLPYPMRRLHDGLWETCNLGGTPLGSPAETTYDITVLSLPPGGVLLAFTDGIPEARDGDETQYHPDSLTAFLDTQAADAAGVPLCEALLADVRNHAGAAWPQDDTTVLCLWHKKRT